MLSRLNNIIKDGSSTLRPEGSAAIHLTFFSTLLVLLLSASSSFPTVEESKIDELFKSIEECIINIVEHYGEGDSLLIPINKKLGYDSFLYSTKFLDTVSGILPVFIYEMNESLNNIIKSCVRYHQIFFLEFRDTSDLETLVNISDYAEIWNVEVKFIVCTRSFPLDKNRFLEQVIRILSGVNIFNFILLLPAAGNTSNLEIISWTPFAHGRCNDYFDNWYSVGHCSGGSALTSEALFTHRFPSLFHNCPVRVKPIDWPPFAMKSNKTGKLEGLEINLIEMVADVLRLKVDYNFTNLAIGRRPVDDDGSFTGVMKELDHRKIDIAMGAYRTLPEYMKYFHISVPYDQETALWCVPRRGHIPDEQLILFRWSLDDIPVELALILIVSFGIKVLKQNDNRQLASLQYCFFKLCSLLFEVSIPTKLKTTKIRIIFISWMLYAMCSNVKFNSNLASVMTRRPMLREVESVNEIIEQNYKLKFYPLYKNLFSESSDPLIKYMFGKWDDCYDFQGCLRRVAYGRDTALTVPQLHFQHVSYEYVDENREPLIHCLENPFAEYYLHLIYRKRYILRDTIDEKIMEIREAGFIDLWKGRIHYLEQLRKPRTTMVATKLSVKHLSPVMYLLIGGLGMSFLIFAIEVSFEILKRFCKKKKFHAKKRNRI